MIESTFNYDSVDSNEAAHHGAPIRSIHTYKWSSEGGLSENTPKAIVQIAHGMVEHAKRYETFAKALVDQGYLVYANDHQGHGKTATSNDELGFFAEEEGWVKVVEDMHQLTDIAKKENPNIPIFLFGHSMGALLAMNYLFHYQNNDLKGVILSGTAGNPGAMGNIGIFMAKALMKIKGKRTPSPFLNGQTFAGYNKRFQPERTPFDWLSNDEKEVDKYNDDPLCGYLFTTTGFYDLFCGVKAINKIENIQKVSKDLPIYLFSGAEDPVGGNGKGVKQVYQTYKDVGITDVSYKLYPQGRHEMLNEVNKAEVFDDVIQWLDSHLK